MKHISFFDSFLENEVNLNPTRMKKLHDSVNSITNFISGSELFKDTFISIVPQGSLAHRTIIRPAKANKEFDADILMHIDPQASWSAKDYVENLYTCFRGSSIYRNMVGRHTRCVRVDYSGDFHIDVVPFIEQAGMTYVTNRIDDQLEYSLPEVYTAWLAERDRWANGNLVLVLRLLKFLRDFKQTFSVKSIILSVLIANQVTEFDEFNSPACYADIPTTLATLLEKLVDTLKFHETMPNIYDPAGSGDDFSLRWDQDQYSNFRRCITRYSEKINSALLETDHDKSLKLWRELFGDDFGTIQSKAVDLSLARAVGVISRSEKFLADYGIETVLDRNARVSIRAKVLPKAGYQSYWLADKSNRVGKGRRIAFEAKVRNVTGEYSLKWKVKNSGADAEVQGGLRGEISDDAGEHRREESTKYFGNHYVECYVIQEGKCIAKDRQPVIIT